MLDAHTLADAAGDRLPPAREAVNALLRECRDEAVATSEGEGDCRAVTEGSADAVSVAAGEALGVGHLLTREPQDTV